MRKTSEELTRKEMIDPQLEKAGWYLRDHSKVKIEITACPDALFGVDGYDAEPWNGVSDYCLYRENGEVLAVVEAKRTSTDVRLAEAQLAHYVTEIEKHQSFRPFGFLANGLKIHFVDVGIAHPGEALPHVKADKLRVLAISSPKRFSEMPDVPAFQELGYSFDVGVRKYLFAPKGLPPDARQYLVDNLTKVIYDEEFKKAITSMAIMWAPMPGKEVVDHLNTQY